MPYITFRGEEHKVGGYHYHLETDLGGQKKVFARFKKRLPDMLPPGFTIRYYSEDDIGIIDEKIRQHMHIGYVQRRFPHNLHLGFLRRSFRPMFSEMMKKCFPKAEINWVDDEEEGEEENPQAGKEALR